jgi:cardiolipin synthase
VELFFTLASFASIAASAVASVHVLLSYRSPSSAVAWLFAFWVLPILGVFLYATFAVYSGPRRVRRRRRLSRSLRAAERRSPKRGAGRGDGLGSRVDSVARRSGALPTTIGNHVVLHRDGADARRDVFELVRSAQRTLWIESYIFERDEFTDELCELLAERLAAGVDVRVLVDAIGSRRFLWRNLATLRRLGIPHERFLAPNPLKGRFQINARNHRKLLVVDGERAFLGGRNFAAPYFDDGPNGYRDTSVRVEGPAVGALSGVFLEDWVVATESSPDELRTVASPPAVGRTDLRVVPHGCDEVRDVFVPLVSAAIRGARESILIVTPYFVPDENVLHDLRLAALGGVEVRLLVPKRSPELWPDLGGRRCFEPLLRVGVGIWRTSGPFLHSKAIVIDDQRAFVGSANFDQRSFNLNYELSLEIQDPSFAAALARSFEPDFARAERIDTDAFMARSWAARALENFVSLFSPLL